MRVLLDCNVLMDVASRRMPHFTQSRAVLDWCEQNPGAASVAWHTVATLYFLLAKQDAMVRGFIRDYLVFGEVVPSGSAEVKHALVLPMKDFEDGLQAAAAVLAGADYIVTRNVRDFRDSPVKAILPIDFLSLR